MPKMRLDFINGLWIVTLRDMKTGRTGTGESWLITLAFLKAIGDFYNG